MVNKETCTEMKEFCRREQGFSLPEIQGVPLDVHDSSNVDSLRRVDEKSDIRRKSWRGSRSMTYLNPCK